MNVNKYNWNFWFICLESWQRHSWIDLHLIIQFKTLNYVWNLFISKKTVFQNIFNLQISVQ